MYWYAAEPVGGLDPRGAMHMASHAAVAPVLSFMARRIVSAGTTAALDAVLARLENTDDQAKKRMILQGMVAGLQGLRQVKMPSAWPAHNAVCHCCRAWRPRAR